MAEVLKKFGRYFLLDRLAQGGMAEIYRARLATSDGAGRLIVIKRIQAGYGANTEFLQMFKSEIKVTMGFNHPNIVQLYDFGEEQAQPYIVMEWVDGKNLRQFITRFTELKQSFPIELAVYIIEQAAGGLYYAHSFKDKITGQPLNIIHRDISPQNILISYEGNIKVIDFGIAKAATNSESTRAGVIKGKPSYLSPEQITGDPLDARCDIFALGTVLWELLAGKKLFAGENDLAVLKLIESAQTHVKPPSTINPRVPKELDYIVLRALAKQREKRYQSAEELQRALHKFLYSYMPEFNPSDLCYYAKDLFKEDIVEDRKRIQKLNNKVEQLLGSDLPELLSSEGIRRGAKKDDNTVTVLEPKFKGSGAREVFNPNSIHEGKVEIEVGPVRKRSGSRPGAGGYTRTSGSFTGSYNYTTKRSSSPASVIQSVILGAVALLAVARFGPEFGINVPVVSGYLNKIFPKDSAKPNTENEGTLLTLQGNHSAVTITANGQVVGSSLPISIKNLPTDTPVQLSIVGQGINFQREVILKKGQKTALLVPNAEIEQPVNVSKMTELRVNVTPPEGAASIFLDGKRLDPLNPVLAVKLDTPLELSVDAVAGYKPVRREFFLDSKQVGASRQWRVDIQLDPAPVDTSRVGYLTLRTTPSAAIKINGRNFSKRTPLENEKFPIGMYQIELYSEALGAKKILTITIQEGKRMIIEDVKWEFGDRKLSGK